MPYAAEPAAFENVPMLAAVAALVAVLAVAGVKGPVKARASTGVAATPEVTKEPD